MWARRMKYSVELPSSRRSTPRNQTGGARPNRGDSLAMSGPIVGSLAASGTDSTRTQSVVLRKASDAAGSRARGTHISRSPLIPVSASIANTDRGDACNFVRHEPLDERLIGPPADRHRHNKGRHGDVRREDEEAGKEYER